MISAPNPLQPLSGNNFLQLHARMAIQKIIKRVLAFSVLLLVFAGCRAQNKSTNIQTIAGKKYYIHVIEKKQSLYALSKLYNVSVDELYAVNPELRNGAKANQEIKIPFTPTSTATPSVTAVQIDTNKYLTYKVGKGETLYSISKKFSLTEKQLVAYNPTLTQGMKEGQVLIVGEKKKGKNKDNKPVPPDYSVKEDPGITLFDSTRFQQAKTIKPHGSTKE